MSILIALAAFVAGITLWARRGRMVLLPARADGRLEPPAPGPARPFAMLRPRIARRSTSFHPVDALDDLAVVQGALATAFLELGAGPTAEERAALHDALRSQGSASPEEVEAMIALGHQVVAQCDGPGAAVSRLIRRARQLGGPGEAEQLAALLDMVTPLPPEPAAATDVPPDGAPFVDARAAAR